MTEAATSVILNAYRDLVLSSANEATTRLRVIDRILREVLNWQYDDISPEEHVTEDGATTYADSLVSG